MIQATYILPSPEEELHAVYIAKQKMLGSKFKHWPLIITPHNCNSPTSSLFNCPSQLFPRLNLSWKRDRVNSQKHKDKTIPGLLSSTLRILQHNPRTSCSLKHTSRPLSLHQGTQLTNTLSFTVRHHSGELHHSFTLFQTLPRETEVWAVQTVWVDCMYRLQDHILQDSPVFPFITLPMSGAFKTNEHAIMLHFRKMGLLELCCSSVVEVEEPKLLFCLWQGKTGRRKTCSHGV